LQVTRGAVVVTLHELSVPALLQQEAEALSRPPHMMPTGWELLDAALGGGFIIPSLNVLGAPPKTSKSTWAQIVAERHVQRGGVAYYLDLENGRRRFARRLAERRSRGGPASEALPGAQRELADFYAAFAQNDLSLPRLEELREVAGDRPLLVVVDSLQKLLRNEHLTDRRAAVDSWVRWFEMCRDELDIVFLVVSEMSRSQDGGHNVHETGFKESGGIEYAADLAMTLARPRADQAESDAPATLKVELARDCDRDPRGPVASYRPVRPFYGLEEGAPEEQRGTRPRNGATARSDTPYRARV
jgi:KaiC/GvpD/RAD55 family RecA-like ATPase